MHQSRLVRDGGYEQIQAFGSPTCLVEGIRDLFVAVTPHARPAPVRATMEAYGAGEVTRPQATIHERSRVHQSGHLSRGRPQIFSREIHLFGSVLIAIQEALLRDLVRFRQTFYFLQPFWTVSASNYPSFGGIYVVKAAGERVGHTHLLREPGDACPNDSHFLTIAFGGVEDFERLSEQWHEIRLRVMHETRPLSPEPRPGPVKRLAGLPHGPLPGRHRTRAR